MIPMQSLDKVAKLDQKAVRHVPRNPALGRNERTDRSKALVQPKHYISGNIIVWIDGENMLKEKNQHGCRERGWME